jgi:WS/DGAT/MGAT family acyltransferase
MRQLTSLDTQFLAAEDGRNHAHVSSLAILDPSTAPGGRLTIEDITRVLSERLHLLPPLRWRLVEVPLRLDYPYWLDDPNFDLEFHVRDLRLPEPGNLEQLAEQVGRIVSRPLDRARPLWEFYLIGGLEDGNVALLTKVHHSLVDGVSGAEILGILFDISPDGRDVPAHSQWGALPDRRPSDLRLLARAVLRLPRQLFRALRVLPQTLVHLDTLPTLRHVPGIRHLARLVHLAAATGGEGRILESPLRQAPRTLFSGRLSPHRRVALASLPLERIKQIKNATGATVNDVIVALCTTAIRDWLIDHHDLPAEPLLSMIPVSVRTDEQMGTFGNRVSVMIVPLATDEADPVARLQRTQRTLSSAKERHNAVPADILANANHLVPPALFARAARATAGIAASSRFAPPYNVIISNVPGPRVPIYIAGARQIANFPVSLVQDGVGLNITVFSYQDRVDFGLVADREMMPDLARLGASLENALAELAASVFDETEVDPHAATEHVHAATP